LLPARVHMQIPVLSLSLASRGLAAPSRRRLDRRGAQFRKSSAILATEHGNRITVIALAIGSQERIMYVVHVTISNA